MTGAVANVDLAQIAVHQQCHPPHQKRSPLRVMLAGMGDEIKAACRLLSQAAPLPQYYPNCLDFPAPRSEGHAPKSAPRGLAKGAQQMAKQDKKAADDPGVTRPRSIRGGRHAPAGVPAAFRAGPGTPGGKWGGGGFPCAPEGHRPTSDNCLGRMFRRKRPASSAFVKAAKPFAASTTYSTHSSRSSQPIAILF